jgi:hypothetical protein
MQINMHTQDLGCGSSVEELNVGSGGCSNCSLASIEGACDKCVDCREPVAERKVRRPKRSMWQ